MPQVFTGKVVIPGDQLDAHFRAVAEAEVARAPFRQQLTGLKSEFEHHLASKYSRKTARKHAGIVAVFIDFLCDHTDVAAIEDITRGMANSCPGRLLHPRADLCTLAARLLKSRPR